MKSIFYFFILIFLISCNSGTEKQNIVLKKDSTEENKTWHPPTGKPDLPEDDSMITSSGMGKIILGKNISAFDQVFKDASKLTIDKDGLQWEARRKKLNSGEWIYAEAYYSVNEITFIKTNSSSYHTENGFHVGSDLSEIIAKGDSLIVTSEGQLMLWKEKIIVRLEKKIEKDLITKLRKNQYPATFQGRISEIGVVCGDC